MDKILFAVNESESSENALRVVHDLLQAYPRAAFIALYVTEMVPDRSGYSPMLGVEQDNEVLLNIRARLRTVFTPNFMQRITFAHRQGVIPAKVICQTAIDYDCDLIVVGYRRKGLMRRIISTSVTYDVLKHAEIPVLLAQKNTNVTRRVNTIVEFRR